MHQGIEARLRELTTRAGMRDIPPAVAAAALLLAIAAVGWAAWRWWPAAAPEADGSQPQATEVASGAPPEPTAAAAEKPAVPVDQVTQPAPTETALMVHVAGRVRHPGVYEVPVGSRVVDAVDAAGGLVGDAALVVPGDDDVKNGRVQGPSASAGSPPAGAGGEPSGQAAQVNVNNADTAALETLPGVGPATAQKIIAERQANGPFESVEDLGRVSGIGPKRIEQLKDFVSVR